jgi:hypothetical protein
MEPNDLNSTPNDDSRLEMLLGQPAPAIPDHGFSTRVLAALPPRTPARRPGLRLAFCSVGAAIGLVAAWLIGATSAGLAGPDELAQTGGRLVDIFSNPNVLLALTIAAASLALTLWHRSPLNVRS